MPELPTYEPTPEHIVLELGARCINAAAGGCPEDGIEPEPRMTEAIRREALRNLIDIVDTTEIPADSLDLPMLALNFAHEAVNVARDTVGRNA
jgi:hypothetical protein